LVKVIAFFVEIHLAIVSCPVMQRGKKISELIEKPEMTKSIIVKPILIKKYAVSADIRF